MCTNACLFEGMYTEPFKAEKSVQPAHSAPRRRRNQSETEPGINPRCGRTDADAKATRRRKASEGTAVQTLIQKLAKRA